MYSMMNTSSICSPSMFLVLGGKNVFIVASDCRREKYFLVRKNMWYATRCDVRSRDRVKIHVAPPNLTNFLARRTSSYQRWGVRKSNCWYLLQEHENTDGNGKTRKILDGSFFPQTSMKLKTEPIADKKDARSAKRVAKVLATTMKIKELARNKSVRASKTARAAKTAKTAKT